jgi:YnbE-like lipoprotein
MMHKLLTRSTQDARRPDMKQMLTLALAFSAVVCGGCVRVQAPDKPIEINLNVNIKQEVIVSLKKDAGDLIEAKPDLFPS